MKLLHIVANLSPKSGGPTKSVTELTEALVRRNIEISIFAPVEKDDMQEVVQLKGVNLRLFLQGSLARWWTSYSPDLARAVRQEASKFALIHIHEIWHHPHFVAYQAAKRTGRPYIVTPHGALEPWCLNYKAFRKKIYATLIQRRILKEATALHALTDEEVKNTSHLCFC
ncbi:glycosyltransferase [Thermodesulfovibrionales bacterium]|nr:glycosyltransferase [Thermodesulfovibrionales bacterium]